MMTVMKAVFELVFDLFDRVMQKRIKESRNAPLYFRNENLKCYYDQKITFIFSSDFETMFVKRSPSEIISVNFEKKTVNLNCNFPV